MRLPTDQRTAQMRLEDVHASSHAMRFSITELKEKSPDRFRLRITWPLPSVFTAQLMSLKEHLHFCRKQLIRSGSKLWHNVSNFLAWYLSRNVAGNAYPVSGESNRSNHFPNRVVLSWLVLMNPHNAWNISPPQRFHVFLEHQYSCSSRLLWLFEALR